MGRPSQNAYSSLSYFFDSFRIDLTDRILYSLAACRARLFVLKPIAACHGSLVRAIFHALDGYYRAGKGFLVQRDVYRGGCTPHPVPSVCACLHSPKQLFHPASSAAAFHSTCRFPLIAMDEQLPSSFLRVRKSD